MNRPHFRRDERGNMAVLFAFGFAVSALVSAVAVDAASLYHERRALQAGVDLAAISAATDPSRAAEIAQSVLVEAQLLATAGTDGLTVTSGHYDRDEPVIAERFTPGGLPRNSVAVSLERPGTLHFAAGFAPPPTIRAYGIAAVAPEISFSVGSRLASLDAGIANALLSGLLGTSVSLSLADYAALAAAEVDALQFLDALALQSGVTAGTYDELLAMEAGTGAIAAALAGLASGGAQTALLGLATSGTGTGVVLGKLLDLGELGMVAPGNAGLVDLSVSALDLLSAAALLGTGAQQVALGLDAGLPGLVELGLDLAVGEPAQNGGWLALGPVGTVLRTAQLRLRLRADLAGGPVLLGAGVKLPLWLDLAPAEAMVTAATCPSTDTPHGSATIAVRPGAVRFGLGEPGDAQLHDFGAPLPQAPVRLVDILLLRITGSALVEIAQTTPLALDFSSTDIANGVVRTASVTTPVASLSQSLLDHLTLSVDILGLGLSPKAVLAQAVRQLLVPLAPILDMTIAATLSVLGLGLGEADLRVYGVRCDRPVLVG